MDPVTALVGLVASVGTLIDYTTRVVAYVNSASHASKEAEECAQEAGNLLPLLWQLKRDPRLSNPHPTPFASAVAQLATPKGPVEQLQQALESLVPKLDRDKGVRKLKNALVWPKVKGDIENTLRKIQRLVSLLHLAFAEDLDHLARAIKDDTAEITLRARAIHQQTSLLPNVSDQLKQVHAQTDSAEEDARLQRLTVINGWFVRHDFAAKQQDVFGQREPGTGAWFWRSDKLQAWLTSPSGGILVCPGAPGAGKTVLASLAVDSLQKDCAADDGLAVACVYCDYTSRDQHTLPNILCSIWNQLFNQRNVIDSETRSLIERFTARLKYPNVAEAGSLLRAEFGPGRLRRAFIVVDALDECPQAVREDLLQNLQTLLPHVNLLFFTRHLGDLVDDFIEGERLEISAAEEDLRAYIEGRMRLPKSFLYKNVSKNASLADAVLNTIVEKANGMFLLARLHLDAIAYKHNPRAVRDALANLPSGANVVKETYDQALMRIGEQREEDSQFAMRVISWVCFAKQPLTATALLHALAVTPGDTDLDEENISPEGLLVAYCAGLIVVDSESTTVRFVHYTTQDYFDQLKSNGDFLDTARDMATACVTYLHFDALGAEYWGKMGIFDRKKLEHPFLEYSAKYWGYHFYEAALRNAPDYEPEDIELATLVVELLFQKVNVFNALQTILAARWGTAEEHSWEEWNTNALKSSDRMETAGIRLATYFDLFSLGTLDLLRIASEKLDTAGFDDVLLEAQRCSPSEIGYGSALHWGALGNAADSVRFILTTTGSKEGLNAHNAWRAAPVHVAAHAGNTSVMRVLLEMGADASLVTADAPTDVQLNVLQFAIEQCSRAEGGKLEMINLLLERDSDGAFARHRDKHNAYALIHAARTDEVTVFQRVLSHYHDKFGSEIFVGQDCYIVQGRYYGQLAQDRFLKNPLHWAVSSSSMPIVKTLLDYERCPELLLMRDLQNDTPFESAVRHGTEAMVQLFLNKLTQPRNELFDSLLFNGLLLAAELARPLMVDTIVASLPEDMLLAGTRADQLLYRAAVSGNKKIAEHIIHRFPDRQLVQISASHGRTPLHEAALRGNTEMVEFLISQKAGLDAQDDGGLTPLHYAAVAGLGQVMTKLLDAGADPTVEDSHGRDVLAAALAGKSQKVLPLLAAWRSTAEDPHKKVDVSNALTVRNSSALVSWEKTFESRGVLAAAAIEQWPHSFDDIFTAALCLQRAFESAAARTTRVSHTGAEALGSSIPTLAAIILEKAEYWVRSKSVHFEPRTTRWHDASRPYLVSERIRGNPASPVRRMIFCITAHDQGYSDNPPTDGNWTWFQAERARGDPPNRTDGPRVLYNRFADPRWKKHVVIWNTNTVAGGHAAAEEACNWMQALMPSDRVNIVPHAQYPGWENYVQRAELEIFTSCMRRI